MKQIVKMLLPAEVAYLAECKEAERIFNLIQDKTNQLHELTKDFELPYLNIVIKLGWSNSYKLCFNPRIRLHRSHITPMPNDKELLAILDYLLKEVE